jgi:hypothetical protein
LDADETKPGFEFGFWVSPDDKIDEHPNIEGGIDCQRGFFQQQASVITFNSSY